MQEVLILTGACGVGKSTIATGWARLKNGAAIDCDYFTEWIHNTDFSHWTQEEEAFVAQLSAKVAIEYLRYGMPTAIENVWTPTGIAQLMDEIQTELAVSIKVVWLFCQIEENHRRDRLRIPDNQMKERVDIVNQELQAYHWPEYVHKVDTTKLDLEQTIRMIEQL